MKIIIVIGCAAVVYSHLCQNMDPSKCTHTCPPNENKICEHFVCACGAECMQKDDCPPCPLSFTGLTEVRHCFDNGCVCHPEINDIVG